MKKDSPKLPIDDILNQIFHICEKKRIKSIILFGSAARNELTISSNKNGSVISDIEIFVLLKSLFPVFLKKKKIFYLNIDNYKIEFLITHISLIKFLKTPLIYDLKTTGIILWGKDIRKSIWLNNSKQIPQWEGVRLLYNRLIDFELLIWKYKNSIPINKFEEYFNVKLLIALGEYFMIITGNYSPSYWDKLKFLNKFINKFENMDYIIEALKYKLNIIQDFDSRKLIELTSLKTYKVLKEINPKLKSYRIPFSLKIYKIIKMVLNKNFLNIFSEFKTIQNYKLSFHLLECFIKSPQKFLVDGKKIKNLKNEWDNCITIQSSYL